MGVGEAFSFENGKGGSPVLAMEPLDLTNRFRTRQRSLKVTAIGWERDASAMEVSIVDARARTLVRATGCGGSLEYAWTELVPVVLMPHTTFYLVGHLRPGGSFRQGTEIARTHPEIVDLGTWHGSGGWCPSAGPRNYVANFRFAVGAVSRVSARAAQVLEFAAQGLTDKAMAERMGIGVDTVECHWKALRERTGCASRTEAVAAHLRAVSEREKEDLEAQRDRLVADAWLRDRRPSHPAETLASMRSWPR